MYVIWVDGSVILSQIVSQGSQLGLAFQLSPAIATNDTSSVEAYDINIESVSVTGTMQGLNFGNLDIHFD